VVRAVGLQLRDLFPPQPEVTITGLKPAGKIVATYDYHDADGNLAYQAVRLDPKEFRQRRPDGNGGWHWNMQDVDRVPYRLPKLLNADPAKTIFVVEDEKDADRLADLGLVATCNVGGAGKWRREYGDHLAGRSVVVIPDNDDPGRDHAQDIGESAMGKATSIKILALDVPDKGDVSDWLDAGGTVDRLNDLIDGADDWKPDPNRKRAPEKKRTARGPSQATQLVDQASETDLFHSPDGEAYATFSVGDHRETHAIRSKSFRRWLARAFYVAHGGTPGAQALQDAIGVLEGEALYGGPQHDVHVRLGEHDGAIFLDLCDPAWRAVKIDLDGWHITDQLPIKFRRAKAMLSLPDPKTGGTVASLRHHMNVPDEAWPLVAAFAVAALRPVGPYPVLNLHGEQGSAKSSAARLLRACIDPNAAPLRAEPKDPRDLMIQGNNGWVIALDNLSHLPGWLSDALCRLSTGGGFSTRTLYENSDETIFDSQRPVILNGITELASRGDLMDRSLIITLPTIPEDKRRGESDLWHSFHEVRPMVVSVAKVASCRPW
jgi:hypothetical protein